MRPATYEYPECLDLRRAGTLLAWTSILATLGGTALWALVPGALHKSSERAPAGAGHKTEVRILGFANTYCMALLYLCRSLGAYPGTCLARGPAKRADNPRARDRRVACSPRAHRCCARRAGLSRRAFQSIPPPPSHVYNRDCRQRKLGKSMGQQG